MTLLIAPNAPSVSVSDAVSEAKPGTLSTEVVVVGTGAGGAAAGTELARRGKRVLFLEAGGAYSQRDFQKKSLAWSTAHLYAGKGPQTTVGDATMLIPQGRVVGGSTVLNSGICFRPPAERLDEWVKLTGAKHLSPDAMAPFVDDIWTRLGVTATNEGIGRRNNALLRDGLSRVGIEHGWIDRNAPTCLGCGVCHLGCPSGAKASVDKALLPEAANLGAKILFNARADRVVIENGRATGVVCQLDDGELRVKADVVIVAGSALSSPILLAKSGVSHQDLGAHLAVHPGFGVFAEFAENVDSWNGVPQGYFGHYESGIIESQGLGPVELFGLLGKAGEPELAKNFRHYALAGCMIRDSGGGRVDDGGAHPKIRIRFQPSDFDAFKVGGRLLVRAWFAAGAKRVAPFVNPFRFYDDEKSAMAAVDSIRDARDILQVHGSHPQGTCRMGTVVDENAQVSGVKNLYVMDGSIFPSTLGTNPQITIMALSTMLARRLA